MNMEREFIYARHAAIITVISMQLIVVYQPEQYDIWDFFISSLCLVFAVEVFRNGYSDTFERILVASNVGVSATYSLFVPVCYLLYFAIQLLGVASGPSWLIDRPFSEVKVVVDFPGRYQDAFFVAEIVVPVMIVLAFFQARPRT